jgi:uncharacterized Ntn-hydrolase superfamily protein
MTFSLIGRCERTGAFGVAITTSSICVGARCPHVRARAGAVATQNITDPTFGPAILDLLAQGLGASEALESAMRGKPHLDYRQLTVIDRNGATASFTGGNILGTNAINEGKNCFAAGNLLSSGAVPAAMTGGFEAHPGAHIAERLLAGLEAGVAAGGEEGPTRSAALLVAHEQSFALVDLRVDWDDTDPVVALRRLWTDYEPQMNDYLNRAVDPSQAPSYGVPGDE